MEVWRQLVGTLKGAIAWSREDPEKAFIFGLLMLLCAWLSRIVLSLAALVLLVSSIHRMFFDPKKK